VAPAPYPSLTAYHFNSKGEIEVAFRYDDGHQTVGILEQQGSTLQLKNKRKMARSKLGEPAPFALTSFSENVLANIFPTSAEIELFDLTYPDTSLFIPNGPEGSELYISGIQHGRLIRWNSNGVEITHLAKLIQETSR